MRLSCPAKFEPVALLRKTSRTPVHDQTAPQLLGYRTLREDELEEEGGEEEEQEDVSGHLR